jgi:uncharacterized protein (TIGR03437 family)
VNVAAYSPAIFTSSGTGSGQAAAVNFSQNNALNGPDHPAKAGEYVTIYMTGAGQTDPPSQETLPAVSGKVVAPVAVTVGGKPTPQIYAGVSPGLISGLIQVNVLVPDGLTAGPQPVVISVGGLPSQSGVTIQVQ